MYVIIFPQKLNIKQPPKLELGQNIYRNLLFQSNGWKISLLYYQSFHDPGMPILKLERASASAPRKGSRPGTNLIIKNKTWTHQKNQAPVMPCRKEHCSDRPAPLSGEQNRQLFEAPRYKRWRCVDRQAQISLLRFNFLACHSGEALTPSPALTQATKSKKIGPGWHNVMW